MRVSLPLLRLTVETRNILVPADGAQVPLVLVVEVDCAERAPRGALADDATVDEPGVAFKVLAVDGEGVCVLVEGLLELLTLIEGVDLVFACACCVDAGAEEDLKLRRLVVSGALRKKDARRRRGGKRTPPTWRFSMGDAETAAAEARAAIVESLILFEKVYGFVDEAGCGVEGCKDVKMVDGRWWTVDGGR